MSWEGAPPGPVSGNSGGEGETGGVGGSAEKGIRPPRPPPRQVRRGRGARSAPRFALLHSTQQACCRAQPKPRPLQRPDPTRLRSRGSPRPSVGRGRRDPPAAARRPRPAETQRRLRAGSWAASPPGIGSSGSRGLGRAAGRAHVCRLSGSLLPLRPSAVWGTGRGPGHQRAGPLCSSDGPRLPPRGPLGGRGRCPRTTPRRGHSCRARPDLPPLSSHPQLFEVGVSLPTAPAGPQCPCGTGARHGASAPAGADLGHGTDVPDLLEDPVPRSSPSAGRRRCRRKGRK